MVEKPGFHKRHKRKENRVLAATFRFKNLLQVTVVTTAAPAGCVVL